MNLASLSLRLLEPKRKAFEKSTCDPIRAQEKVLLEYLHRNRNTEYGRKYGFSGIRSISSYQAIVPIVNFETIRPLIDRMTNGEQNILTKDKPIFFGSTSGTTNLPKLIPTTRYSESKKREILWLWSYYIARDHPEVVKGKVLAIISPEIEGRTPSGIRYGAETGHGYRSLPGPVRHLYALPPEVFEITNYDARYYTILRLAMESNISDVASLNPNTIILLCQKIPMWQHQIIDDIRKGTLQKDFEVPEAIRASIEKRLRANPERASALSRILDEKKALLPKDFWLNMRLIECWKGGMMKLYLKELETYFGDTPVRDMGCLSTEARSSIPTSDEGSSGVLAISSNFYEFIPKEDMEKKERRALLCHELTEGKEYFIIVTTAGGLYRYNIDDIIKVTGWFNETPLIEFIQKGLSATSLAGEKLYESQLNDAVNRSLEKHGLTIEFFSAIAEARGKRYIFLVEFSERSVLSDEKKKVFLASIEEELLKLNREYDFTRKAQILNAPILKVVRKGDFEKYRAKRILNGAHEGQFKVAELTQDQDFEKNFTIEQAIEL